MAARNGASGCRTYAICASREGRSLIQCRESDERTAAKDAGGKGSGVVSGRGSTVRVCEGRRALKGRSASR